jgi:sigma-B regulation protein RsbU (phosphoserine phosphatase)
MKKLFNPIKDKSGEIIECLMSSPDMPTDEDLRFKLRLSIEETVENVVQYAYKDSIGWMEVETNLDEKGFLLTVTLKDAGKKFNPLEMPDPDVNLPLEEREIGGLGIFLCKQFMDEVEYHYEDGCNILTMKKNIAKQ